MLRKLINFKDSIKGQKCSSVNQALDSAVLDTLIRGREKEAKGEEPGRFMVFQLKLLNPG